jgi:hypothetical protein
MTEEFLEIEHKFLVGPGFDMPGFEKRMESLGPTGQTRLRVADRYFLSNKVPGFIYRHRFDNEMQHLSIKSMEQSAQVRTEINLDLGQHRGDQKDVVEAFLSVLDVFLSVEIIKDIVVFHFPTVEAVYYDARYKDSHIRCVEFEATAYDDIGDAHQLLKDFENKSGFGAIDPTESSLFELLVLPNLPFGERAKVMKWLRL